MKVSRYTFTVPAKKGSGTLICNYLSGTLDLLSRDEAMMFQQIKENKNINDSDFISSLKSRGYVIDSDESELALIQERYIEFSDEYERTATQLIFVPTYLCNFSCSYCFQDTYHQSTKLLTQSITDSFFNYIDNQFATESTKPYITLFGGEPLLGGDEYRNSLIYFLQQAALKNYDVCIVTNGYELSNYIPEIKKTKVRIKEIQVTLDGDEQMHNKRRKIKSGKESFQKSAQGITDALHAGYRINLRMIIDKENLASLPALARIAEQMGWMNFPASMFETTIGRNYELHSCQNTKNLFDRVELYREYAALCEQEPILKQFHKPQFHGMRHLKETGSLPLPIFDGCPAGKKEWAFDVNGDIYSCTASVGVQKYKLGSFINPDESQNIKQKLELQKRDVLTIPECIDCSVALSCGGGCAVLAANQKGSLLSPDCRPVAELVSIGASFYDIVNDES